LKALLELSAWRLPTAILRKSPIPWFWLSQAMPAASKNHFFSPDLGCKPARKLDEGAQASPLQT